MRARAVPIAACGRRAAAVAGLICAIAVSGCARTEEYQLGQRIDMGPYSFEVTRAEKGTWASTPTIDISFRLTRDDTAPFTADFNSSFAFKMEVVDAAGNTFTVAPHAVSPVYRAGRYRSDRYRAEVRLSPSLEGVRDGTRIGNAVEDFRLIIDNPAREGDQPRRVVIPLH